MRRALAGWGLLLAVFGGTAPAQATFPGANGRIAYTWSRGGEGFETPPHPRLAGIVSVRPDGGGSRLVARGGTDPRYSPDGRRLAFLRSGRVWVARAGGGEARPVTPAEWDASDHEWSPSGARLALVRQSRAGTWAALYVVRADGSGLKRLFRAPQGLGVYRGAWSPGGTAIVIAQFRAAASPLVRVVRGERITTLAGRGHMPTWSRRGLIAYELPPAGGQLNRVCVTRPVSAVTVRCFGFADAATTDPTWSPDGRRLMLMYTPQGRDGAEIWTVRPDGTLLTRAPRDDAAPIFSPDGGRLAFSLDRFGGDPRLGYSDLYVARPDGTGRRRLVRGGQAQAPDWQPRPSVSD